MNVQIELNSVDQHIKSMMLTFPTLMGSRLTALKQLFMSNGNGYEWGPEGKLVSVFNTQYQASMDFSDLEERQLEVDRELAKPAHPSIARLYASRSAALKREFAERRLIADEIDLYAVEHVMGEETQYSVEWMSSFDPRYCVFRDAPFSSLNPVWAAAAEEALNIAMLSIWRHLGMFHDEFDRVNADAHWLRIYDELDVILDKLNATTGTKERNAQRKALAQKIMSDALAETGQ